MSVETTPNANFSALGGASPHETGDERYRLYRAEWEGRPRRFEPGEFPVHLDLEASARCNLNCTFCDKRPVLEPSAIGDLDYALFTRIMDEAAEHNLFSLKFSYRGEPLLHPRLPEMVAYAKARSVLDVYFNTNAMLLDENMAHRLIDAGLDRISISIEGTDPAAYEACRVGASFARVRANLEGLGRVRSQRGMATPRIRVQTVRLPGMDLEEYTRFWLTYADEVACVDFNDVHARRTGLVEDWACPQLWQRMTIAWNGQVMGCNNDDFQALCLGNAARRTVRDCWLDPVLQRARELHRAGKSHLVQACEGCPWRTTQILKLQAGRLHP